MNEQKKSVMMRAYKISLRNREGLDLGISLNEYGSQRISKGGEGDPHLLIVDKTDAERYAQNANRTMQYTARVKLKSGGFIEYDIPGNLEVREVYIKCKRGRADDKIQGVKPLD